MQHCRTVLIIFLLPQTVVTEICTNMQPERNLIRLRGPLRPGLRYVTEQEGTIQLSTAAKCPNMGMLLQQIAESYPFAQCHDVDDGDESHRPIIGTLLDILFATLMPHLRLRGDRFVPLSAIAEVPHRRTIDGCGFLASVKRSNSWAAAEAIWRHLLPHIDVIDRDWRTPFVYLSREPRAVRPGTR